MKANITFVRVSSVDEDDVRKITLYCDTKDDIYDVLYALGKLYILSNVYIKDEEKKEN